MTGVAKFADLFASLPPSKGKITMNNFQSIADALANFDPQPHLAAIAAAERALEQARADVVKGENKHVSAVARLDDVRRRPDGETMADAIRDGSDLTAILSGADIVRREIDALWSGIAALRQSVDQRRKAVERAREDCRNALGAAVDDATLGLETAMIEAAGQFAKLWASAVALHCATHAPRLGTVAQRFREPVAHMADARLIPRGSIDVPDDVAELLEIARPHATATGGTIERSIYTPRAT